MPRPKKHAFDWNTSRLAPADVVVHVLRSGDLSFKHDPKTSSLSVHLSPRTCFTGYAGDDFPHEVMMSQEDDGFYFKPYSALHTALHRGDKARVKNLIEQGCPMSYGIKNILDDLSPWAYLLAKHETTSNLFTYKKLVGLWKKSIEHTRPDDPVRLKKMIHQTLAQGYPLLALEMLDDTLEKGITFSPEDAGTMLQSYLNPSHMLRVKMEHNREHEGIIKQLTDVKKLRGLEDQTHWSSMENIWLLFVELLKTACPEPWMNVRTGLTIKERTGHELSCSVDLYGLLYFKNGEDAKWLSCVLDDLAENGVVPSTSVYEVKEKQEGISSTYDLDHLSYSGLLSMLGFYDRAAKVDQDALNVLMENHQDISGLKSVKRL